MHRFIAQGVMCLFVAASLVGCKSTDAGKTEILQAPPAVRPLPPVTSELPPGVEAPPVVACEPAPPKKTPWWRQWLPTDTPNDTTRERGEFKDGWMEPEYRGISD